MTVIKYSFTSLSAAAEDIETSSRTITGQLEDLKAQIKLMVSAWEGDAADSYKQHQDKWDAAALELTEILSTIARAVEDGNQRMKAVITAAANSWA